MLSEKDEGVSGAVIFSTAHTLTHMASQDGGNVTSSLDLSRQFTSSGVSVPVEIVDASGHTTTVLEESTTEHSDLSQDERMEISIEEISQSGQSLAETLTVVGHSRNDKVKTGIEDIVLSDVTSGIVPSSVDSTQLTPRHISNTTLTLPGIQTNATPLSTRSVTPASLNLPTSLGISIDGSLDPHLTIQQVSQSAIQHFQEALRNEGIEISPETIANHFPHSLAESLAASIVSHSSHPSNTASILESAISQSAQSLSMDISYGDISDVSHVINDPNLTATSSNDQMGQRNEEIDTVLSEPHVPSSPESNFDTSELLNSALTQDVELTTKLASAGPVGVAAAAAIMSGRKRRKHVFESNPALRKRHCSKLLRRLRETLDELSTRVGLQACVVTYRPSSKQEKPEPAFKVFGTSPLNTAIEEQKYRILNIMDEQLKKQMPQSSSSPQLSIKQATFELPPLVFEGIPTPVHEMTQAQLRGFIPHMLKYATGRGKPGWGKEDMRPPWWPEEIPWQNVRSDVRDSMQKKAVSWTECLRKIITACYTYHGRVDLLQTFSHKPQDDDMVQGDESGHHLQLHLHNQHGIDLAALQENVSGQVGGGGDVSTLPEVTTTQDQSLMPDQQQVFTIDTGMGSCDTSGMPTLADASLAETAARLQQVADETGQVQYATQTVTVTEGDAKALGQPVGSTTTVLLTAYPSGQTVGDSQQYYQPSTTSASVTPSSATSTPSVQVVYSAAHVSELPEAIVSSIASSVQQELYGQNRITSSETESDTNHHLSIGQAMPDSSEYFVTPSRATGDDIMVTASNDAVNSGPVSLDLASQYISNYPSREDSGILVSASEQDATEKLASTSSSMVSSERNIDQGICLETRKNIISKDLSANSTSL